mmetsp:Transcript_21819/g.29233  ORF Transcript_21819/g.29233 Transcript_21819/m.29233 type:complete len:98 (+) Transcript_21819:2102-2395(+)|eukprot:CAMPEP_0170454882 /NCGR_PEP_ID=MMETSP0123-20130129/2990_1 /TAXON_ID=182087 /ORGANISM="Favella ehrenbergii, Strain Fehren 1" /LENGTH=97 /DNA_ID=CAMNT_0010717751 /DNA_START=1338 /DNA_END=1631 /DNA_ORIENTATION=-
MKRHKGPLSLMSELESIEEADFSDKAESSRKESHNFHFDVDDDENVSQDLSKSMEDIKREDIESSQGSQYENPIVRPDELRKILQVQNTRNRSHSVI